MEWQAMTGKFRDFSALESLAAGETEAMRRMLEAAVHMDGFAHGAEARFAAIEARLKALEEKLAREGENQ
jgi:ATP-dependent 26S proteasome regulatory subunit